MPRWREDLTGISTRKPGAIILAFVVRGKDSWRKYTLQVDDGAEDDDGSQQAHNVGQVLPIECFAERELLVGPGDEQMHEGDDSTLELGATASVDGGRREGSPDDGLADVGRDEQRDSTSQSIALLQQLIKQDDDEGSDEELDNKQDTDTGAEVCRGAVETGQDVDAGLAEGDDDGEEFLCGLVEFAVGFEVEVDVDEVGAGEELEDHAGGDDGGDAEFHEGAAVTRQHHAEPIHGVGGI